MQADNFNNKGQEQDQDITQSTPEVVEDVHKDAQNPQKVDENIQNIAQDQEQSNEGEQLSDEAVIQAQAGQIEQLQQKMLLLQADMENLRRRTIKEKQEASTFAISNFARDLLAVMDNFERALTQMGDQETSKDGKNSVVSSDNEDNVNINSFIEGIKLTKQELEKTFSKYNITRVESIEKKFDSNIHQALMEVESSSHESGVVVQVIQEGYTINGRLLRPAMVGVAKNKDG